MAGITAIKRKGFQGGGSDTWGPGASSPGTTKTGGNKNKSSSAGNQNTGNAREDYISNYVSKGLVKGGGKKKEGPDFLTGGGYEDSGLTQTQINNAKKFKEEQQKKSDDYNKAKEIYNYQPNKALNYVPFIGPARNIFGTPFTKAGKTRMAKRRMEYINSLPPQQRRAMIERLGYAEDEEYDELDEFALNQAGIGPFNQEDVDFNFGRFDNVGTDYNLTGNPLSYVGENPIYGMDAYDIINYDGEYLKRYGQDLTNTGGGGDGQNQLPYIPTPADDDDNTDETIPYRFGTGQKVGRDVTLGYAANGGRITRAGGGIMNAVPRQGYFLGGIGKAIKGVVGGVADAAGKVLKSDLGRYAIMAAGMYYGGGGASAFKNKSFMEGLKTMGGNFFSKSNPLLFTDGKMSMAKLAGISTIAPYLFGEAKPNEDIGMAERGGRLIDPLTGEEGTPQSMRDNIELAKQEAAGDPIKLAQLNQKYNNMLFTNLPYENYGLYANGGRIARAEGGLMNLGGMEKDYRAEGGFVPIGKQEKADDVPARLSVNEFVFTADAVRNAGGGDIDKGAEVMENMMKNLENGGTVSEESQGNTGAQEMFSVSERIGEVI